MTNKSDTDKEAITVFLEFFGVKKEGSNQKSLIEIEKEIEKQDDYEEEYELRCVALNNYAKALERLSDSNKFEAVYQTINYFSRYNIEDYTVVSIVLEKLNEYKGKELSDKDIVTISAWGNSLIEWSWGLETKKEEELFKSFFGEQNGDHAKLSRGISCAVLSLLPVEYQKPGAKDFIGHYDTGVIEAYIRFLGYGLIDNEYNTKDSPMSPSFSLEIVNRLFGSFADWLQKQQNI